MKCYVCNEEDWHRVTVEKDGKQVPIHTEATTQICKNCGSACHAVQPEEEEKVKEYYRKEYRPQPNILNLLTTTHKQNYIRMFLANWLQENAGKQKLVGDVGAATGYLLNFFRKLGHKVAGSELTVTYRRMSEHYYGIPLSEELEPKHKYDLITCYHVLEHLIQPDKKLAHLVSLLADDGHMMIATPQWFDILEEGSGTAMQSFDNLFHKNHINLFSATSIQNLFRKCGLSIVKEDHFQYGQTYLLAKAKSVSQIQKEDWHEVLRIMVAQYRAIELFLQGKFRDAYELYPKFPEAWLSMIFGRSVKDIGKQTELFDQSAKYLENNSRYMIAKAQWFYQHGRLQDAITLWQKILVLKPNEDIYMYLGYALSQAGRQREAIECFQISCALDPRKWSEAQQWILSVVSQMPAWDERALDQMKKMTALPAGVGIPEPIKA